MRDQNWLRASSFLRALFPFQTDSLATWGLGFIASIVSGIVVLIVAFLIQESTFFSGEIGFLAFIDGLIWSPLQGRFSLVTMVLGTLLTALGATAFAFPFAFFTATFMFLHADKKLTGVIRSAVDVMAGIPSVVYGFWGLTVLVPWIGQQSLSGANLLSAIIILGLMILPTMASLIFSAFREVPKELVTSVRALALNHWEVMSLAVLPQTKTSILTAIILALGRAFGETMAVLMVCGNIPQLPSSLLDPVRTLTTNIALELGYAEGTHRTALFVTGLFLMLVVFFFVLITSMGQQRVEGIHHVQA